MGGVWVFPGGAVEQAEGDDDRAHRAAAVRELREEAGVELPDSAEALVKFSRWITPAAGAHPLRHPLLPRLAAPRPGATRGRRGVRRSSAGSRPPARSRPTVQGEIVLVFPTIKHLEQLAPFATAAELLDVRPRAHRAGGPAARGPRRRGRARAAPRRARLLNDAD